MLRNFLSIAYADFHDATMIGQAIDGQDMYAYPILLTLAKLDKPDELVKELDKILNK